MEEDYEQLDYDEEELKSALQKAQQLKDISEKEQHKHTLIQNSFLTDATKEACNNTASKCYVNPNFTKRDTIGDATNNRAISLVPVSSRNVFHHHSLQRLCQQAKPHDFYVSGHARNAPQVLPIVPRQTWPSSYCSSFAQTVSSTAIPSNIYINPSILSGPQPFFHSQQLQQQSTSKSCLNWDLMVDDFVRKTISVRTQNYSKPNGRSSSSNSSFSKHTRSLTRSYSREFSSASSSPAPKRSSSHGKRRRLKTSTPNKNRKQTQISKQTIECAKAIGLDKEYLKKIEEQQRLREEIARKKAQHRKENNAREIRANQKSESPNNWTGEMQKKKNEETSRRRITTNRLRPYLAVVVTNLTGLNNPCEKVTLIANKIGPVKVCEKVWRENESNVHLIFEKHEDAKKFMQQYIGDSAVFGRMIDVTMKKVFLNTATA